MKFLTDQEVFSFLDALNMHIAPWGDIKNISNKAIDTHSVTFNVASDENESYRVGQLLAEWVKPGEWVICKFDNSNCLAHWQWAVLLATNAALSPDKVKYATENQNQSILMEFDSSWCSKIKLSIFIGNLIAFGAHAHIVSKGTTEGQLLSIQDGCIFFEATRMEVEVVEKKLANYLNNKMMLPEWLFKPG